jgi:hypothetical protein
VFFRGSSAYTKQISCIKSHVDKCLKGSQWSGFSNMIVDVVKNIVFNCGTSGKYNLYIELNLKAVLAVKIVGRTLAVLAVSI